jgi:hypothetical protein
MLAHRRQPLAESREMVAKKSIVRSVVVAVKDAAMAVGHVAEDRVVHPVGEALGLLKKKPKGKSARKAARKEIVKAATEKKKSPTTMSRSMKVLKAQKKTAHEGHDPAIKNSKVR